MLSEDFKWDLGERGARGEKEFNSVDEAEPGRCRVLRRGAECALSDTAEVLVGQHGLAS